MPQAKQFRLCSIAKEISPCKMNPVRRNLLGVQLQIIICSFSYILLQVGLIFTNSGDSHPVRVGVRVGVFGLGWEWGGSISGIENLGTSPL